MAEAPDRLRSALADRYAVRRELGRGGMATVYLAEDLKHRRQVAIKVLEPELAAALGAERFLREIETAARLHHSHILSLYDSGEANGVLYYVMPYVEGESLRDRLDREQQLPLDDALQIARDVSDALSYAHSHDVVHRDIKPENIMLESGHAMVADFGIARAITAAGGEKLTATGLAIGTPLYMSPEQAAGEGQVDGRSDLYSLGCVLYEMLAGEPPHTGPTAQAIIAKRLSETPPSLRVVRETVSEELDQALTRVLAKAPADRFPTAAAFADALIPQAAGPEWVKRPAGPLGVIGLYALSALAVIAVVQFAAGRLDLPGWVLPGAVVLLLVGFPIILGAALVQRGAIRLPGSASRLFTWRRAIIGGVAAFVVWGVVVTGYVLLGGSSGSRDAAPAESAADPAIAVLPFRVVGSDLEFWRAGMVHLLSDNLEGIEGLRKADPTTVLIAWGRSVGDGRDAADAEAALEVAREVGARYAVTGSVVQLEGDVRLSADVYDVERSELRGSSQIDGPADSVFLLVDRLTLDLLGRNLVPAVGDQQQLNVSRATTTSLPALKAYLSGEENYRRARWREAIRGFHRALELDSTFVRAMYRLGFAYAWGGGPFDLAAEYVERAAQGAGRLPEREAMLVRGAAADGPDGIPILERFTGLYPDDVEGWASLGDAYFHLGATGLYPSSAARDAFETAVELSPYYGEAYQHLIEDAFTRLDSARARELIDAFDAVGSEASGCTYQLSYDLVWGDPASRARALAALDTVSAEAAMFDCVQSPLAAPPAALDKLERIYRSALNSQTPELARAVSLWRLLQVRVPRGQIAAARQALSDVESLPDTRIHAAHWGLELHLGVLPDTVDANRAARVLRDDPHATSYFWLGALAVAEGRWEDVEQTALLLEEAEERELGHWDDASEPRSARLLAPALRAYAALARGDRERLPAFEAALWNLTPASYTKEQPHVFLRYQVGRMLLDWGELRQAERYFQSFDPYDYFYTTQANFFLGRIYEELGQPDEALVQYDRFVTFWRDSDPELRPWWEEGREALLRLTQEPRSAGGSD